MRNPSIILIILCILYPRKFDVGGNFYSIIIYYNYIIMFSSKNTHYLLIAGLVIVASYVGMYSKQAFSATNNEYDMIKKYLLNDSPLYGFNKTKLWIH
jgi:hypothetical protein